MRLFFNTDHKAICTRQTANFFSIVSALAIVHPAQSQGTALPPVPPRPQPKPWPNGPTTPPPPTSLWPTPARPYDPTNAEDLTKDPKVSELQSYSAQDMCNASIQQNTSKFYLLHDTALVGAEAKTYSGNVPTMINPDGSINNQGAHFLSSTYRLGTSRGSTRVDKVYGTDICTNQLWALKQGKDLCWESTLRVNDLYGSRGRDRGNPLTRGVLSSFFTYTDQGVASESYTPTGNRAYGVGNNEIDFEFLNNLLPGKVHLATFNSGNQNQQYLPGVSSLFSDPDAWINFKIVWSYADDQKTRVRWFIKRPEQGADGWVLIRDVVGAPAPSTPNNDPNMPGMGNTPPANMVLNTGQKVPTAMRMHFNIWAPTSQVFPEGYDDSFHAAKENAPDAKRSSYQVASASAYYRPSAEFKGKRLALLPPDASGPANTP